MCTSACPSAPRPHAPAPLPPLPQVARWEPAFCGRDPVLAALHGLFAQLERQEAARSAAAAGGNGGSLPPVDPGPLREALAALPNKLFQLGGSPVGAAVSQTALGYACLPGMQPRGVAAAYHGAACSGAGARQGGAPTPCQAPAPALRRPAGPFLMRLGLPPPGAQAR